MSAMMMTETRTACNPLSFASINRMTRNMPKRRLFTFESFPFGKRLSGRRGQEPFRLPAVPHALGRGVMVQTSFPAPYHKRLGFATVGDKSVNSGVGHLFNACRPAAISRLVVAIVVDAVNALLARPLAHIRKEVLEGKPAFADFDATPTISEVTSIFRVIASVNNPSPDVINTGSRSSVSPGRLAHSSAFGTPAAAGFRTPVFGQEIPNNLSNRAALTATDIDRGVTLPASRVVKNGPAIECLPGKILCHASTLMIDNASSQEVYYV